MTKDEFVESLVIDGRLVNVGIDDYGQQYFFEFVDDDGKLKEVGCGSYNTLYVQEINYYFEHHKKDEVNANGPNNKPKHRKKKTDTGNKDAT